MKVEDIPAVRNFPSEHQAIDAAMRHEVALRAAQHRHKQKMLAQQYRGLFKQWQLRCEGTPFTSEIMTLLSPYICCRHSGLC